MYPPPPVDTSARGQFEDSFHRLLVTWTRHQDLRRSDPTIAQLASSRSELDRLRLETHCRREQVMA